jgi:hypothetical protein
MQAAGKVAIVALLLQRGCPTKHLAAAMDWLGSVPIPADPVEMVAHADTAIAAVT